jgi:hypothetical protein
MSSFSPEKGFLAPNAERLPEAEEALYKIIVPENESKAIQLDEFADLYDPEIIKRDKEYVKNLEGKFSADGIPEASKKYGRLFEAVINNQIENSDLMGPAADVIIPSRFDDIANGIDSIVRFKQEKGATSHLALAIDVTRSRAEIENKFSRIRSSIEEGNLSRVKYFKTKNFRGELTPVARVVIGADHAVTEDISNLMLSFMRMQKTIAENRRAQNASDTAKELPQRLADVRKKLARHPLQQIVLIEIRTQLEAFQNYAHRLGKQTAADEYGKILHFITEIIEDKDGPSNISDNETVDNDEIYRLILENAKSFER